MIKKSQLLYGERKLPHVQIGGKIYYITFTTLNYAKLQNNNDLQSLKKIDRIKLNDNSKQIIMNAFKYWHNKRIKVHIICVMNDHVHSIIEPLKYAKGSYCDVSNILRNIKSYTSHEINKIMNSRGSLWEIESWDRIIRDEDDFFSKWDYIINNPVEEGYCTRIEDYPYLWIGN